MGKVQGGPSALFTLHHLTLHLAEQAVEQRLGNGIGGALVGKARPLLVEIFRIGEVGEPSRLLRGEELLQRPGLATLCLRFADHAGADDKEVVEHQGIHFVAHIGHAAILRVDGDKLDAARQIVDKPLAENLGHPPFCQICHSGRQTCRQRQWCQATGSMIFLIGKVIEIKKATGWPPF